MKWERGLWKVEHPLPLGTTERAEVGDRVAVGGTLAVGAAVADVVRVSGARHIGIPPEDLAQVARVRIGQVVVRGTVLARLGRRFARAAIAPIDGRVEHISRAGDFYLSPAHERWLVRSSMSGAVARSSASLVVVQGDAWALSGIAAYGPDAIGEIALAVRDAAEELRPHRIDVRLRDRILVGAARVAPEAVTRAHACGVSGLVTGAVPAGGLRVVYGEDVGARGGVTTDDRPTLLCLAGFGTGPLPESVFAPFAGLVGSLASIHVESARLFVFADAAAIGDPTSRGSLALASDWSGVRPLDGAEEGVPAANVLGLDAAR